MNFVKRVVAGPGDRLAIDDGHVILNGERQEEPFIRPCTVGDLTATSRPRSPFPPITTS